MTRSTSKESSTGLLMSVIKSLTQSRDTVERDREKANLQKEFQESDARLDKLVLKHHADLTSVMQAFSKISTRLHSAKDKVQGVHEKLMACQKLLHCKRDELKRLWLESVENKHVLKLLATVDSMTRTPSEVKSFVSQKHYLHATTLLVKSIDSLDGELKPIDALNEIKNELLSKKEELYEALLGDLNRHVYSRSTVEVLERLKRQGPDRKHVENTQRKVSVADILSPAAALNTAQPRRKSSTSHHYYDSTTGELLEDLKKEDPEEDSRQFMFIIIDCLDKLNKVPEAIEAIQARADKELISIVKKTGRELLDSTQDQLNHALAASQNIADTSLPTNLRDSLVDGVPDNKAPLLQDVLDVLYSQFKCVVDVHQQIIIPQLQKLRDKERISSEVTIYHVDDIWAKVQSVLRLVADLYIEMCTSSLEKTISNNQANGDENLADLNNYFARKKVGLSAAVGNSFAKSRKCPLFRFDSSSHAISLNAYLREQKEAAREKSEATSEALDSIDIERILSFVARKTE
ncbi:Exocyst complex component 4 [Halotydeus destructor]|nr:Exocyst complex component 4 [Halotydeus destructor]